MLFFLFRLRFSVGGGVLDLLLLLVVVSKGRGAARDAVSWLIYLLYYSLQTAKADPKGCGAYQVPYTKGR